MIDNWSCFNYAKAMAKINCVGMIIGLLLLFFAVPLGDLYGQMYLGYYRSMETAFYIMLMDHAITGFQVIGGGMFLLCAAAYLWKEDR